MLNYQRPLKVLHICQRDDPATGGAARVAVEYVKRLPNYHIDAHCLFVYGPPGPFQEELGDRAHFLGLKNSQDCFKMPQLWRFINNFSPKIIHHHEGLLWTQILTFYHPKIIKVAHAHTTATVKPLLSKGFVGAWLQRLSTDYVIAITKDTCQSYVQRYQYAPHQIKVLYNGVDLTQFYPPSIDERLAARHHLNLPLDQPIIGFVGRLHCATKGTDDFLRMIALLPANFWGLVVGEGPDAQRLHDLAKDLKIENRVVFTGLLARPTVAYHTMNLFCFTSNIDAFGLVVAEAMASGLPVVGFACEGGVKEILTPKTGWVIPDRNLNLMAETVMHLIACPEKTSHQRNAAMNQITQYHDWGKSTEELANYYYQWAIK